MEINDYCQRVIKQRIKDGVLDEAPIFGDIRAFNREGYAEAYQGMVDVLSGGFPCQPFSHAGKMLGADDERNMWPETIRAIRLVRPRFVLLENVPGLLTKQKAKVSVQWIEHTLFGRERRRIETVLGVPSYFGRVLRDLSEGGYECRWRIVSAAELGAPHIRKRLWIVAHPKGLRWDDGISKNFEPTRREGYASWNGGQILADTEGVQRKEIERKQQNRVLQNNVSDATSFRCEGDFREFEKSTKERRLQKSERYVRDSSVEGLSVTEQERKYGGSTSKPSWWDIEPGLGRVANGVANRVDRLKALGNGQVPAVAATAWILLTGFIDND